MKVTTKKFRHPSFYTTCSLLAGEFSSHERTVNTSGQATKVYHALLLTRLYPTTTAAEAMVVADTVAEEDIAAVAAVEEATAAEASVAVVPHRAGKIIIDR